MPRHVVQDLCKWGCFDLKYTMCSQDFFKWRVVFEGPQDSLPDLSESYQNWVLEWDVEILVRKHHLSSHLLKSTEHNSKIFKANWNEWNGRLGIPQTSSDENTNWGTKVASSVRCWTSQETFPTILQRWSSALSDSGLGCYSLVTVVTVVNSADCWNCCALSCKVWNGDVASKYLSGWSRVHLHPSSSWHRPL